MRTPSFLTAAALLASLLLTPGALATEYVSQPYAAPPPYLPGLTDAAPAVIDHAPNGTYAFVAAYAIDKVFGQQVPIVVCLTLDDGNETEVCHDLTIGHRLYRHAQGAVHVRAWVYAHGVSEGLELSGATTGDLVVVFA